MTRVEQFRQELKALYDWDDAERDRITERLKENGEYQTIEAYSDLPKDTKIAVEEPADEQRQSD